MLVSELVRRTSVSLATVKYYLREGLLHPGRRITARSADYDETHVRRLALLRILREVGGIPVERLRALVEASEDTRLSVHDMFARATDAMASPAGLSPGPRREEAGALAERVITATGWSEVRQASANRRKLEDVVEVLLDRGGLDERAVGFYADAADRIARVEIASLDGQKDRADLLEDMVVGTVVYGELLNVLRRLGEEHHSAGRFRDQH